MKEILTIKEKDLLSRMTELMQDLNNHGYDDEGDILANALAVLEETLNNVRR